MAGGYKGNRGEAQSYIEGFLEQGYSKGEIADTLRDLGLGYRTQNMYRDINRAILEQFGAEGVRRLSGSSAIPENLMREWQGETEYNYRVVVTYDYFDNNELQMKSTGTTLYYNEAPTQDQVAEDFKVRRQTIENIYMRDDPEVKEISYYRNVRA